MNNKTFGIVVGIVIAVAIAMVTGLYMLGTVGNYKETFDKGYEDDYTIIDEGVYDDDSFYSDDSFYFDADGNMYELDDIDFYYDSYDIIE